MLNRVADILFPSLNSSPVLRKLYSKLLKSYTRLNFGQNRIDFSIQEIDCLLSFASLLSKSPDAKQRIVSEQIVALLGKIFPDSNAIRKTKEDVLESCTNYIGLSVENIKVESDDIIQGIVSDAKMQALEIPCQDVQDENGRKKQYFIEDQKVIFDSFDKYQFVSYSAPTSLGKSFIMRAYIKYMIAKGYHGNFAIVVPTKALINEMKSDVVEKDLKGLLSERHNREVSSVNEIFINKDTESNFIFIVTPERLHYLLNNSNVIIDCCFMDESYKISEPDSRSLYYYQTIGQLLKRNPSTKIIFSSPNIPNPEVYFGTIKSAGTRFSKASKYSPVSQIKYLISLKGDDEKIRVFNDLTQELEDTELTNPSTNLNEIISVLKSTGGNIVYCSGKDKAVELAIQYATFLKSSPARTEQEKAEQRKRDELSKKIERDIHEDYYLAELVRKGVAYHVGYLPNSLRSDIEKAFKSGVIKTIFCTSTLMEGVNLPADNLFVTSTRTGREAMSPTAFENLLGRIGRINYSLFGNVYLLIIPNYASENRYEKLLKSEVKPQKLSLDTIVTDDSIVAGINEGNYDFGRKDKSQALRIAANMYINDVKVNDHTLVRERIDGKCNRDAVVQAESVIETLDTSDSIDISPDQHVSLKEYIEKGGHYPDHQKAWFDHDDVKKFLDTLSDIYKWDKYEFESIKNGNSTSYYATILSQWMSGHKIKEMVDRTIKIKQKYPYGAMYNRRYNTRTDYIGSPRQKNEIIRETLETIEETILFTIANYFREFSKEYKRFHGVEYMDNDWYEYVEFGTCNPISIALQRNGYVRETAKWIQDNDEKLNLIDRSRSCKFADFVLNYDSLMESGEDEVVEETKVIAFNVPELFVHK